MVARETPGAWHAQAGDPNHPREYEITHFFVEGVAYDLRDAWIDNLDSTVTEVP